MKNFTEQPVVYSSFLWLQIYYNFNSMDGSVQNVLFDKLQSYTVIGLLTKLDSASGTKYN